MIEDPVEWVCALFDRGLVRKDPNRYCACGTWMPFAGKFTNRCHRCLAKRKAEWQYGRSHQKRVA